MDRSPLTIAIVAGEPSGDLLGADLIRALRARRDDIRFVGIGGPQMIETGFDSWFPMTTLSINGFVDVVKNYPSLARMRSQLTRDLLALKPDLFIGIDSPDFNLDLECRLKADGITTMHYISPTIWAWRSERIYKIGRACDHILVLFPFEAPLYEAQGIDATCVGHPMADRIPHRPDARRAREAIGCADASHVFALLPGSRRSEVEFHADLMVQTAKRLAADYPGACFVVPAVTAPIRKLIEAAIARNDAAQLPFIVLDGQSSSALEAADAVVVASGTATLETALWKKPMVVTYKVGRLTWQIVKRMVKLKCIALPNILSNELIVPEYLQETATPERLSGAVRDWLDHPDRIDALITRYDAIHAMLERNASETAADTVLSVIDAHR